MKIQKLSFSRIKNVLSRAELKKIMAGSDGMYYCCACQLGQGPPVEGYYYTSNNDCDNYCYNLFHPPYSDPSGYEVNSFYCGE